MRGTLRGRLRRVPHWVPGVVFGLAACGGGGTSAPTAPVASAGQPSFVVIIVDDMAADLFGPSRTVPFLSLPNLERLGGRGVFFDHAFVTTSLCSPSRATMLSGLYAHSHRVLNNQSGDLSTSFDTYPRILQRAGYQTALVGKWHMDGSTDAPRPGFDYWVSFKGQGVYENPTLNDNGKTVTKNGYLTDILTDYAVQWLRGRSNTPFLLVLSHKAPHDPFTPAERHRGAFPDAALPEPPNFEDSFQAKPSWQRRYVLCGGGVSVLPGCQDPPPAELPPWNWPAHEPWRLDYMRTLMAVDDSVGSVLSTLEAQGHAASTYVVFIGDNGMFLGAHRLGDKRLMYEESIRVPFVIGGGAVASPRHSSALVLNLDLAPTLLQLAGLTVPPSMQGRSLAGLVRGQSTSVRDSFLYEYFSDALIPGVPAMQGVRTNRWAYVSYPDLRQEELYDLDGDPGELTNQSAAPERLQVKASMREELARLQVETNDPIP